MAMLLLAILGLMKHGAKRAHEPAAVRSCNRAVMQHRYATPSSLRQEYVSCMCVLLALAVPLRFLITQPGVWQCWLRLMDIFGGEVPARTRFMREAIRSPRYGVEFGSSLLITLISLAFSIISPLIPLFGFAFYGGMWIFWR